MDKATLLQTQSEWTARTFASAQPPESPASLCLMMSTKLLRRAFRFALEKFYEVAGIVEADAVADRGNRQRCMHQQPLYFDADTRRYECLRGNACHAQGRSRQGFLGTSEHAGVLGYVVPLLEGFIQKLLKPAKPQHLGISRKRSAFMLTVRHVQADQERANLMSQQRVHLWRPLVEFGICVHLSQKISDETELEAAQGEVLRQARKNTDQIQFGDPAGQGRRAQGIARR